MYIIYSTYEQVITHLLVSITYMWIKIISDHVFLD